MSVTRLPIDSVIDYQNREAWLAARRRGVGASESAALFGLSPFHSRFSLWLNKTGRVAEWQPEGEEAERLEWGQVLEGPIADMHAKRTGRKLWHFSPFCIAESPDYPAAFATPDRFIIEAPDRPGAEGVLEVKNTANTWHPDSWADGVPAYVQVQVQQQLAVTGRDFATVTALANGNRLLTWDIDRNEEFIAELKVQVEIFWESVLADKQPPPDVHPRTLAALKRLHPLDNGETIDLPPDASAIWDELCALKGVIKSAEARKDAAETQLRALLGPYTYGALGDGRTLSFKTVSNAGGTRVIEPYTYRTLRLMKATALGAATKKGRAA
jgi:putative phage-type endonuclease